MHKGKKEALTAALLILFRPYFVIQGRKIITVDLVFFGANDCDRLSAVKFFSFFYLFSVSKQQKNYSRRERIRQKERERERQRKRERDREREREREYNSA